MVKFIVTYFTTVIFSQPHILYFYYYISNLFVVNLNDTLSMYVNFWFDIINIIWALYQFQLLGREVYASNNQLGGIQIMYNNGISHKTDPRDLDGIYTILKWLSYIPKVSKNVHKVFILYMHKVCLLPSQYLCPSFLWICIRLANILWKKPGCWIQSQSFNLDPICKLKTCFCNVYCNIILQPLSKWQFPKYLSKILHVFAVFFIEGNMNNS